MQERVSELVDEALTHPEVGAWSTSLWREANESLVEQSGDRGSAFRRRVDTWLVDAGVRLRDDPVLQEKVDDWIVQVSSSTIAQVSGQAGGYIAATVEGWDAEETTDRIETQVGRDLQFIRINGTIVGGLAGLLIYTFGHLIW